MGAKVSEEPPAETNDSKVRGDRRWPRLVLALICLAGMLAAATWIQRRTIARGFIDGELARRGVRARYELDQLSPWRQRLTNVVIGDPRRPDLEADWIEVRTAISPWQAEVLVIRAGKVHVRSKLADGRLSFGAIDRLLPAPSGAPFALPHVALDIADGSIDLDAPQGAVRLAFSGKGMLDDGFAGQVRAAAPRLEVGGCSLSTGKARFELAIRDKSPTIRGPIELGQVECGATRIGSARLSGTATISEAFDAWQGSFDASANTVEHPQGRGGPVQLRATFAGRPGALRSKLDAEAAGLVLPGGRAERLRVAGNYFQQADHLAFNADVDVGSANIAPAVVRRLDVARAAAEGTPLAPLLQGVTKALAAGAASFSGHSDLQVRSAGAKTEVTLANLEATGASGARIWLDRGAGIAFDGSGALLGFEGVLTTGGGGLPDTTLRVTRAPDGQLRGSGFMRPYSAGGARLELARLDVGFDPRGAGTLQTVASFSGPLAGGRVEQFRIPLDLAWSGSSLRLNPECVNADFARLRSGSLAIPSTRIRLCPLGGAMLRTGPGGLAGGIRLPQTRIAGTIGENPLLLALGEGHVDFSSRRFAASQLAFRLGHEQATRLDASAFEGRLGEGEGGSFEGLGGQIANVPLIVSQGAGSWRFVDGGLSLTGKARVADSAEPVRFHPLVGTELEARVTGSAVEVAGTLAAERGLQPVGGFRIEHDLGVGAGFAAIDLPGLQFAEGGLQPSDLTPLTFGVIADVSGSVSGAARIDWTPDALSSSGSFAVRDMDLAASFGPVQGLSTELRFTDLLGMRTAAGQVASIAELNPGVPVRDGTLRYELLDSRRVRIEGARWPFAGGELVLDPTVLDFGERQERRMTFRVIGADAAQFLKEMGFDNLNATGVFDGVLPMVFDESGGRVEGGALRARGAGSIAYVGELSQQDLGFWGNMAFQALKALDYKQLSIDLNGPLAGEMVTQIRFEGLSQGEGTRSNFLLRRLAKLPFVFNVRINAPFQQLLDSVQSWYDPSRLIERNLEALIEEEQRQSGEAPLASGQSVQPPESDKAQ
jgi:translocation and assembly module TamB